MRHLVGSYALWLAVASLAVGLCSSQLGHAPGSCVMYLAVASCSWQLCHCGSTAVGPLDGWRPASPAGILLFCRQQGCQSGRHGRQLHPCGSTVVASAVGSHGWQLHDCRQHGSQLGLLGGSCISAGSTASSWGHCPMAGSGIIAGSTIVVASAAGSCSWQSRRVVCSCVT